MIVVLSWGSLIWDHRDLPVIGLWRSDGPASPVEFARQSPADRLTLVIAGNSERVPVFWTPLDVRSLDEARHALTRREVISPA